MCARVRFAVCVFLCSHIVVLCVQRSAVCFCACLCVAVLRDGLFVCVLVTGLRYCVWCVLVVKKLVVWWFNAVLRCCSCVAVCVLLCACVCVCMLVYCVCAI